MNTGKLEQEQAAMLLERTIDLAAAVMPISRNDNSVSAIASQHGPHNDGA
jgi:hypothetical protein